MKVSFRLPFAVSAVILPFIVSIALAQQDSAKSSSKADAKAADKGDAKAAKPRAKPRGRLPAYYGQVVNGQQREKIYAIQQQYEPKITALKAELQALQDKVDAEVEAVLTPEQLVTVKKLTDEAKAKRKAAGGTASTAADGGSDDGDDGAEETGTETKSTNGGSKTTSTPAKTGK